MWKEQVDTVLEFDKELESKKTKAEKDKFVEDFIRKSSWFEDDEQAFLFNASFENDFENHFEADYFDEF